MFKNFVGKSSFDCWEVFFEEPKLVIWADVMTDNVLVNSLFVAQAVRRKIFETVKEQVEKLITCKYKNIGWLLRLLHLIRC